MKKEFGFVFILMLLTLSIFVSADWISTETEFVTLDDSSLNHSNYNLSYIFNLIFWFVFFILICLTYFYFRKINKGKFHNKKKVKKNDK